MLDVVGPLVELEWYEPIGHTRAIEMVASVERDVEKAVKGPVGIEVANVPDLDFVTGSIKTCGGLRTPHGVTMLEER